MKFYTMEHRGGLNEALETKKEITQKQFNNIRKGKYNENIHYKSYCYDKRISCYRLIIIDMEKHIKNPTWLLIEIDKTIYKRFKKLNLIK